MPEEKPVIHNSNPFRSFWMGGFECSDQLNTHGNRVDFLNLTAHLACIDQDYERLRSFGIRTAREGIRWSQIEIRPYQYNFEVLKRMVDAGIKYGIQQIWDICHFGYPDDLSPLHPHFTSRFVALCKAFAAFHKEFNSRQQLIVTPITEVSFISWLGGDVAGTSPFCRNNGWEVKYALMRAYIAGTAALKNVDPQVRILTTEPLVNIVPAANATESEILAAHTENELQYQVLDMLSGRICPELGGKPEYLDILGFNYYYNNQWTHNHNPEDGSSRFLPWNEIIPDVRWRPLSVLLTEAFQRYNRPIALTETSHPGIDRPIWIRHAARECSILLENQIPFWGICLYPIIDRPDWDNLWHWHNSGLWDHNPQLGESSRILHEPYAVALLSAQAKMDAAIASCGNAYTFLPNTKQRYQIDPGYPFNNWITTSIAQ